MRGVHAAGGRQLLSGARMSCKVKSADLRARLFYTVADISLFAYLVISAIVFSIRREFVNTTILKALKEKECLKQYFFN